MIPQKADVVAELVVEQPAIKHSIPIEKEKIVEMVFASPCSTATHTLSTGDSGKII